MEKAKNNSLGSCSFRQSLFYYMGFVNGLNLKTIQANKYLYLQKFLFFRGYFILTAFFFTPCIAIHLL